MTVEPETPPATDGATPPAQADPPASETPPAEPDYKAEAAKWKEQSRKQEQRAKENADAAKELAELKEKDKTEAQRQADALTSAEARAAKAEAESLRLTVALEKAPDGMPLSKVKKLAGRLVGSTQEELEADAEELFADFKPAETGGESGGESGDARRRPAERLKPGGAPGTEPEETDPTKLAAQVPRMY